MDYFNVNPSEKDFLTFSRNPRCDAVLTKVHYTIYKKRTIKDASLSEMMFIALPFIP
ncbi:Hypothetical protein FKW44_019765, partial [Caligus rogercresseyi]